MIMLSIDPGLRFSGYSIIKKESGKTMLIACGYLTLPQKKQINERIGMFYTFFEQKITALKITDLALETPFLGKNAQNFLKLGYLRGILYLLSDKYKLSLHEYTPREVKQAITGFGGATKEQLARVLLQLFPGLPQLKKEDATDALAVGLCALWRSKI